MTGAARIGFMQGRLCDRVNGMIQAFPWGDWEKEFPAAEALGLTLMEWTLDHARMDENPIMTEEGRARIAELSRLHGVGVLSLTGDNFMHAPFWKAAGAEREALVEQFRRLIGACGQAGINFIVVPFVDAGRIEDAAQEDVVVATLIGLTPLLEETGVQIVFESDFTPQEVARFVGRLPAPLFGVNYDMGNSAALGFDPADEIAAYGRRILNVHVKDRVLGGTTVPLGTGSADLPAAFAALRSIEYPGAYILQTARSENGDHAGALANYRSMTLQWLGSERAWT